MINILFFRNYLRAHPEARMLYEETKKKLAQMKWKYVQNYADAKSEVVAKIMDQALEEAKKNN